MERRRGPLHIVFDTTITDDYARFLGSARFIGFPYSPNSPPLDVFIEFSQEAEAEFLRISGAQSVAMSDVILRAWQDVQVLYNLSLEEAMQERQRVQKSQMSYLETSVAMARVAVQTERLRPQSTGGEARLDAQPTRGGFRPDPPGMPRFGDQGWRPREEEVPQYVPVNEMPFVRENRNVRNPPVAWGSSSSDRGYLFQPNQRRRGNDYEYVFQRGGSDTRNVRDPMIPEQLQEREVTRPFGAGQGKEAEARKK